MRSGIIFSVFLRPFFHNGRRPRLKRQTTLYSPANVYELLSDKHVQTTSGRAGPVVLDVPDPGQIRFSIGCSRCGRIQVWRSVRCFRNSGARIIQPLSMKGVDKTDKIAITAPAVAIEPRARFTIFTRTFISSSHKPISLLGALHKKSGTA